MLARRQRMHAKALSPVLVLVHLACASTMPESERIALREEVREMFTHGYDNYMRHAFPKDELKPISCQGVT